MMLNTQQASIWVTTKWLIYIDKMPGRRRRLYFYSWIDRKDLNISKNDIEIVYIEITDKTKNIILSSVYRASDSSLK